VPRFRALAIDLALIWYVGDRAYPDVFRAVEHGARLSQDAETPILNSKTVVGPVLWHRITRRSTGDFDRRSGAVILN